MRTAAVLAGVGIVPVVTLDDAADAAPLGEALEAAGLRCVEVTLRTAAGLAAVGAMAAATGLLVGAGTVLTTGQVDAVADEGAAFVVSPGLDDEVVARTLARGLAPLPGVATATEVQRAVALGLDVVKFFPASALGGLPTIAALAGPFPDVRFVPSGGVDDRTCQTYAAHPAVLAVSGSWLLPARAVAERDWAAVTAAARQAVQRVAAARVPA